ncbi:peptide ligase PGM1-related protein [Bradyrhizobium sp.]|uniref:peptide ligase PGM1-related protein n=1 Tax=Bradyrhizobium sp. TaxID=376 RepID=UPI003C201C9B
MIGALSEFGKLGVVCIGATPERADSFYRRTIEVLDREGRFNDASPPRVTIRS